MQRWQCSNYNSTLENFIWSKPLKITSDPTNVYFCDFLNCFWNAQVTVAQKSQMKINSLKKLEHGCLIYTWSDKAFKNSIVNRTLLSLQEGSLEITLTVPLISGIFFRLVSTLLFILQILKIPVIQLGYRRFRIHWTVLQSGLTWLQIFSMESKAWDVT